MGPARRCAGHSPEVRSATRAELKLDQSFEGWLEAVEARAEELKLEAGNEPTAVEKALSLWAQAFREMMLKLAAAVDALETKRERARLVRQERDAEHLAELVEGERKEAAERAVRSHEVAIEALYVAQTKQRDLQTLAALDAADSEFGSRHEVVAMALADAEMELGRASAETEARRIEVTPLDERVRTKGARKGLPGQTQQAFLEAQRREKFWADQSILIRIRLRETPSNEHTERMLALTTEAVAAGKQYVLTTRAARDGAMATARARSATETTQPAELTQLPQAA